MLQLGMDGRGDVVRRGIGGFRNVLGIVVAQFWMLGFRSVHRE